MSHDVYTLPPDLPVPADDGAADHLVGTMLPPLTLESSAGQVSFRELGLYTFTRWHNFFTNPPLCITEAEMIEAFAIIDKGLEITDRAVS